MKRESCEDCSAWPDVAMHCRGLCPPPLQVTACLSAEHLTYVHSCLVPWLPLQAQHRAGRKSAPHALGRTQDHQLPGSEKSQPSQEACPQSCLEPPSAFTLVPKYVSPPGSMQLRPRGPEFVKCGVDVVYAYLSAHMAFHPPILLSFGKQVCGFYQCVREACLKYYK